MNFKEYNTITNWLETNGYEVSEKNIQILIEAGFFNKIANAGKKFVLPLAAAGMLGGAAQGATPQMHRYNVGTNGHYMMLGDKQQQNIYNKETKSQYKRDTNQEYHIKSFTRIINDGGAFFMDVIQTKNTAEGTLLIIDVSVRNGGIRAYNEASAKQKFVEMVKKICLKEGFDFKNCRTMGGAQGGWNSLSASQIEAVQGYTPAFRAELVIDFDPPT